MGAQGVSGGGVPVARTISAGSGLTGGGDLSANRSLAVSIPTRQVIGGIIQVQANATVFGGAGPFIQQTTEAQVPIVPTRSGTLQIFRVVNLGANVNNGQASGIVLHVRVNYANSGITVTIPIGAGASTTTSDTVNTLAVVAGDLISVSANQPMLGGAIYLAWSAEILFT